MGLIKKRSFIAIILFLVLGMEQWAQNTGLDPGQLGAEILSLEQKLVNPGISMSDRYNALVRLARLRQLSGDISGAAINWLEAAAANPNDDTALVSGAYCLIAIGEWGRASLAIRPLIASGRRGPSLLQAYYLDACLRTWSYGNASPLAALAADPEFLSLRPMIYYTLWQIIARSPGISGAGGADSWKTRLIAEYPKSPEAIVANSGNPAISAVQSPLWLLFPGAAGSNFAEPSKPAVPAQPAPAWPAPPAQPAPVQTVPSQPSVPTPRPPANTPAPVMLQTGVFSREADARVQWEALLKAGFTATVSRKLVNGAEHWAVTVPAGQDTNKTIQDLKRAGFDSFPVK